MNDQELIEKLREDFISDIIFSIDSRISKSGETRKFLIINVHFYFSKLSFEIRLHSGMKYNDIKQKINGKIIEHIDKNYKFEVI